MQVIGGSKSTNPSRLRWAGVGAEELCNSEAAMGSLITSVEAQWTTKLDARTGIKLLREHWVVHTL